MFVVTGDRKARLQFFRDMGHQKVNNQRLLEIFIDKGGFCRSYTRGVFDFNFYEEFKKVPKKYVVTSAGGWNYHTSEGDRWTSMFWRSNSRNIIYMDLSEDISTTHFADFMYSLCNLAAPKRGSQVFINSELSKSDTIEAVDKMLMSVSTNNASRLKFRYINCVDKGKSYVYNVFDEDFERPYEEEVGIE